MSAELPKKEQNKSTPDNQPVQPLVEGEDYYLEAGRFVFTSKYHLKRGYCCNSGCRHCPYNCKK